MKRKKPLLKNEIKMLQLILEDKAFPRDEYISKLVRQLEELKAMWYKVKPSYKTDSEVSHGR